MNIVESLGGVADPAAPPSASQLADLTRREVARGLSQAAASRQGYDRPLALPVLPLASALAVAVPLDARIRSDGLLLVGAPRGHVLLAAAIEALTLACELAPVTGDTPLSLHYGDLDGALVIAAPWPRAAPPAQDDAELAALQLDDRLQGADRLRAVAVALPASVAALLVPVAPTVNAIGHRHPLDELEVLVRAGADPVELAGGRVGGHLAALVDRALGPANVELRPHADPDPARRLARRMLQGLAGKRKWSGGTGAGYHTEVTHLMRGFDGADRELANAVVDALLEAGLLVEKVSVGQRHVSLHSRRKAEIEALIARGDVPPSLRLPRASSRLAPRSAEGREALFFRAMLGTVSDKVHVARIMARTGVVSSSVGRPDRGFRAIRALGDWGASPAGAFTAAAIRSPGSIGVIDERGQITYREIHQRSNAIAHRWAQQGIGAGDVVALMARNHRGFVEASVAIAKLGAHVLYLNTAFAGPQIEAVCKRENTKVIVHDEEFGPLFDALDLDAPRLLSWVDDPSQKSAFPTLTELIETGSSDDHEPPARSGRQIILTSGTTGMPKGAQRPEPKGIEPIAALLEAVPYRSGDRWMIAAPVFHAWGFLNWVLSTALGGTAVLRRKFDPEGTLDWIARYRCENLVVVPVMLQRIVELGPEVIGRYDLSSLRTIVISGSALPGDLAGRAMDLFGDVVYNLYGSTEVATATVAGPEDLRAAPGTAGRALRWTTLKIFDEHGKEVPRGEVGRVFIGNGLAFEGYTGGGGKARIEGLLSSGDVGHLDAAGRLFIDGRDDDMIISGGENVFPREIEDLLSDHAAIEEASVIGVEDERWGQGLKAFVVLRDGGSIDAQGVKDHVKAHLAGYKVPREVVFLDALPRNATGKVLKRELRSE